MSQMVTIPKREYEELRRHKEIDRELLTDIANGIKDILKGRVREI